MKWVTADFAGATPLEAFDHSLARRFAQLILDGISREYPNLPHHILVGDDGLLEPRKLHPAFYGCFDWHSAVHSHWSLARLLRVFPDLEEGSAIRSVFTSHLTAEHIAVEAAYFDHPMRSSFERPYGWAWLLRLAAELDTFQDQQAQGWADQLRPLSEKIARMLAAYLEKLVVPNRVGTHNSTAYALTHAHDYAVAVADRSLQDVIERKARSFYGTDVEAPTAYEPSGEDFISPALIEADLMRRVLEPAEFVTWFDAFLPPLQARQFKPLLTPPVVSDLTDYRIGHLIGLCLQRAASYKAFAQVLPQQDPRRRAFVDLAQRHSEAGIGMLFDSGYGGGHWLASFAIYLLTGSGPY